MKLHLPLALLLFTLCPITQGALLHNDVDLLTYTDFGQNRGRYSTTETNALLQELNKNGISISYTGGQESYTINQPMIDFHCVADKGNAAAVGYGFLASVWHLRGSDETWRVQSPTFSTRDIGTEHAIQYQCIEYGSSDTFCLHPEADYKLMRLSKIVTDATPAAVYNYETSLADALLYSAGAGDRFKISGSGTAALVHWWSQSIDGSIMSTSGYGAWSDNFGNKDSNGCTDDSFFIQTTVDSWGNAGISTADPLPALGSTGDSGSPVFIWNRQENRYEFLGVNQTSDSDTGINQATAAPVWTVETMANFDQRAYLTTDHTLNLSRASTGGEAITDSNGVSATPHYAILSDSREKKTAEFTILAEGYHTWKSLSTLKESDTWYTYVSDYLNASKNAAAGELDYADLYLTENMVLNAADSATYTININEDIDTGIGYIQFSRSAAEADFKLTSANGSQLDTAGYVVDANVCVTVELTNSNADHMREWRKVGDGHMILAGEGKNEIFLNLGGTGTTTLNQQKGYAAYKVLASTGSRVVLNGIGQIAADFTSGNGGSILDFNGCEEWREDAHFSIHALTQDSILTNSQGHTSLYFSEGGNYLGSFADSATGSLRIIYEGTDRWELNSIHTQLLNSNSGLTVAGGHVSLSGTLTVHANGSVAGEDVSYRYTNENDWHYADATMNIQVEKGATFELDSHARLTGNVTVHEGGTYLMREGVYHAQEYIEGGYELENTADIAQYYGHHGATQLEDDATLRVAYHAGVTVENSYDGDICGTGTVEIDLGTDASTFRASGDWSEFHGNIALNSGTLLLGASDAICLRAAESQRKGRLNHVTITREANSVSITGEGTAALENVNFSAENEGLSLHLNQVILFADCQVDSSISTINLTDSSMSLTLNDYGQVEGNSLLLSTSILSNFSLSGSTLTFMLDNVPVPQLYDFICLDFSALDVTDDCVFLAQFYNNPDCVITGTMLQQYANETQTYTLVFDTALLPESSTSALALLALAAAAIRRRRK